QEFPRDDERLVGRRHRYGYAMSADGGADPGGSLFKHDFHTGARDERAYGAGRQPGEFVFVPRHDDAPEDDGVLLGFVFDPATQRSDLTLLDAETLETVA
ncbi:carotenoid oxygenase family protein, partial [Amycolatopsis sp. 505]|uniref:carotenoid oxygenase family protein n=1 Tax=Amycolatopsis sp. 505 TaxID=2761538 RepID=UPI0028741499